MSSFLEYSAGSTSTPSAFHNSNINPFNKSNGNYPTSSNSRSYTNTFPPTTNPFSRSNINDPRPVINPFSTTVNPSGPAANPSSPRVTYVYGPPNPFLAALNPFHTATILVVQTSDNNNPFSTGNHCTSTGNNPTNQLTFPVDQDGDLEMGNNNLVGASAQTNNYEPDWMDTDIDSLMTDIDSVMTGIDSVMTDADSVVKDADSVMTDALSIEEHRRRRRRLNRRRLRRLY